MSPDREPTSGVASDTAEWRAADAAFETLLDLPPDQQDAALAALSLPQSIRAKTVELLRAHRAALPIVDRLAQTPRGDLVGRSIGGWRIERELGRGGMAVVYEASRAGPPQRRAALKLMTLGSLAAHGAERFAQEQQILAQLSHPHIAPLYEAGVEADGTPWLAMALIEGQRIDQWCAERGLDSQARVRLLLQVCEAVAYAHRRLVVHRDIKPSNVLVDAEGQVFLLDFGIARLLDDAGEATASQLRALSPLHAAPEQFRGAPPSTAMDVYGLGALLYQLLAGRAPREAGRDPDAMPRAPSRPGLRTDADLDAICLQALAPDPAQRYGSVDALAADLRRWLAQRPVQAQSARGARYRLGKFLVRHRLLVAAAALLLLAIVVGAAGTAWQAHRARIEAERALAESARAQRSLARMTALRDFLLGLFTASYPDRPRGELPTTAELLAEGARQAGSGEIADPLVRSEMLGTLGHIYFVRGLSAEAEPLLEQAEAVMPVDAPRDVRERLLRAQGDLAEARGDIATAVARYDAAIALYDADPDDPARLALEGKRGFLELQRNDPAAASARLAPLLQRMQRIGLPLREQRRVLGALVIALAREQRYGEAQTHEHRLIELTRELEGQDSRAMAMVHGNAIGLAVRLGDFAGAERHAREAIGIYDRIFDTASNLRAGARTALGDTLRYAGRFEDALAVYEEAFAEQAAFLGQAGPQQLPQYRISRGRALAYAERCEEAVPELREADRLLRDRPGANPVERPEALTLLARCVCQSGDAAAGRAALADIDRAGAAAARDLGVLLADADAECALAQGRATDALSHWEHAAELQRDAPPGDAGSYARHALRRAQLLQSLGRDDEAAALRTEVRRRLLQVGLQGHPLYPQTDRARAH